MHGTMRFKQSIMIVTNMNHLICYGIDHCFSLMDVSYELDD